MNVIETTTPLFVGAGAVSLGLSALLVVRLERIGARFGLSEALLGLVAALAADAPEIASAVTAIVSHQRGVAVGVLVGSNIFNLATLLGLGAIASGRIALHRRVVLLAGTPALWVAVLTMALEHQLLGRWPLALLVYLPLIPYLLLLERPALFRLPERMRRALVASVEEEEADLVAAIHPRRATRLDLLLVVPLAVAVVVASVVMEHAATRLGAHAHWSPLLLGGVVLAGVTSLPNAVAAIYLARHGRGAAALSTAMHSNTINIAVGLVIPSLVLGVSAQSRAGNLLVIWYLGLTLAVLSVAYLRRGIGRLTGACILAAYGLCLYQLITQ